METKEKKAWWQTLIIVVMTVITVMGTAFLIARTYFTVPIQAYYNASEKAFVIPGLDDGFVPQGLHYDEGTGKFFVSGYFIDGSASPIYVVDKQSGKTEKKVLLAKENGEPFCGHSGGVAVHGEYLYLSGENRMHLFPFEEFLTATDGESVRSVGEFLVKYSDEDFLEVSFVCAVEDGLIVGEFHDAKHYPTLDSHKYTTKNGDYHKALALFYPYDENGAFGISAKPQTAFSLPDCVQGMAVKDGKTYLSTSWGATFSKIYEYDTSALVRQDDKTILGETLPLYAFDSASLTRTYKIAPMSEEIAFADGKLFVMCESAAQKYLFGRLAGGKWCYATDLTKF